MAADVTITERRLANGGSPPTAADFRTIQDGPQSTQSGYSLSMPSLALRLDRGQHVVVEDYLWHEVRQAIVAIVVARCHHCDEI